MFFKIGILRNFPMFASVSIIFDFFNRKPLVASADLFFLIKYNVEWLLLKRFAYLAIVRYLYVISRNHSNTLLLINLQKPKTCPE